MNSRSQRGAALFVGMIFLLVLTVLALTAARVSTLDERMAGNYLRKEQAQQVLEEARSHAMRYVTLCNLGDCPTIPDTIRLNPQGLPFHNMVGLSTGGMIAVSSDEELALASLSPEGEVTELADSVLGGEDPVTHRAGTVIMKMDLMAGLTGLEPGSTQQADYFRVTTAVRKGDLSGTPEARATDVVRQVVFIP